MIEDRDNAEDDTRLDRRVQYFLGICTLLGPRSGLSWGGCCPAFSSLRIAFRSIVTIPVQANIAHTMHMMGASHSIYATSSFPVRLTPLLWFAAWEGRTDMEHPTFGLQGRSGLTGETLSAPPHGRGASPSFGQLRHASRTLQASSGSCGWSPRRLQAIETLMSATTTPTVTAAAQTKNAASIYATVLRSSVIPTK